MADYRRLRVAGGTYFFTVVTAGRRPWLGPEEARNIFRRAYRRVARELPLETVAAVVLPDHVHCIWRLPAGDADFSNRWRKIKRLSTNALVATGLHGPFWQPRFWEHVIRDETDLAHHVDYIHYNPVRHGLVARPIDWPASSLHRYVEAGWYPADWAAEPVEPIDAVGEPQGD